MEKKLKIRDLEGIILGSEEIYVYRSLTSHSSGDYEDLYKGSYECIFDTLKDLDIFMIYPSKPNDYNKKFRLCLCILVE